MQVRQHSCIYNRTKRGRQNCLGPVYEKKLVIVCDDEEKQRVSRVEFSFFRLRNRHGHFTRGHIIWTLLTFNVHVRESIRILCH